MTKHNRLVVPEDTEAASAFVPPCTRQVFMKYYSSMMTYANYWTEQDAEAYENDIDNCLAQLEK